MGKKKQPVIAEDDSDEEDVQFVVEVVKAAKVEDGEWKYLVKWANYSSSEDTWEPHENLEKCTRLLTDFWGDVGLDNDDYTEGYVVHARPSWIKKEKKMFANQNKKKVEESSESEDEPMPSLPPEKRKGKGRAAAPLINKSAKGKAVAKKPTAPKKRSKPPKVKHERVSDDSDNVPLASVRSKGKKRAKAPVTSSDGDEADEDERPLAKGKQKATIIIPPAGSAKRKPVDPNLSDSAGSLFSEKSASSPEAALKRLPAPTPPTIPMKRPSIDASAQRTAKRQIMEMPMQITGTAGNATKARIAQRMPPPPPAPGPLAPQKLDLSKLSFKKTSAMVAGISPAQSPVVPSPVIPPLPRRSTSASDGQSPAPGGGRGTPTLESHTPGSMVPAEPRRPSLPLPRRSLSGLAQPPGPMAAKNPITETDRFLNDIMPAAMASPMEEDVGEMPPPPVPIRATQTKPSLPRIQKKWKWTGDLFMDVSRDRAEHVCEIMLSEPTEPLPGGLRFNICLTGDNIRLSAFHDLSALHLFLLASARAQQFAKLSPAGDKDADVVKQLGTFMQRRSFFSFAHLYMDDDSSVGLLIVFPTGHEISEKLLKVPPTLAGETPLQAALVPWELTAKEFRAATWKSRSPTLERTLDPAFAAALEAAGRKVTTQRRFYQALHILGFPKSLYDFLFQTQSPRPYCIWSEPADTPSAGAVGYETSLLREILAACPQARDVGHKTDVRIVFVHVGALETLQALPALALRRMKRSELRFMTYGTHSCVPQERWGIREIYVLGGIVTFTPSAIIEGHWKAFRCIKDIAEHPIWDCYILPSVVAMVAKLTCQGQHPLRVYDEGNFVYEDLLKAIEQGTIALLHAPTIARNPTSKGDASLLWTRWQLRLPSMKARQILEECLRIAAEQFANVSDADLPMAIEKEIARDTLRMQLQPVIMDQYRRFVVVKGQSETYFREDKCGIETTTLSELDFRDDFFTTSTNPAKK